MSYYLTSECSQDFMTARRVAKENEALTRGLNKLAPCIPPSGTGEEMRQVGEVRLVILVGMGDLVSDLRTQPRLHDGPKSGQGVMRC